jgi:hypothetical protein
VVGGWPSVLAGALQQQAAAGRIELFYLDEAGFAPTLPTGFTWARTGVRPLVRYEAPKGRRVNAIAALAPFGPAPRLVWASSQGKLDATAFLDFVCGKVADLPGGAAGLTALPAGWRRDRRCVIVLDNYSVHRAKPVKEVLGVLERVGVELYFLPAYSPQLNLIEAEWRQVKYQDSRSAATSPAMTSKPLWMPCSPCELTDSINLPTTSMRLLSACF